MHPDVVFRADGGTGRPNVSRIIRGATAVAGSAIMFAIPIAEIRSALVNGAAGVVIYVNGQPFTIMGFTVSNGKIVEIDAIGDPERLNRLDVQLFNPWP